MTTTTPAISEELRRLLVAGAKTGYLPVEGETTNEVWTAALNGVVLGYARQTGSGVKGKEIAITACGCIVVGAPILPELMGGGWVDPEYDEDDEYELDPGE